MGANSSPPATDAMVTNATKTKKRKTSDAPLPSALAAQPQLQQQEDDTTSGASANATAQTCLALQQMAAALDLGQSLVSRALLDPMLAKTTSLSMEDSRVRLQQMTALMVALHSPSAVESVAAQLQRLFVGDAAVLATLRDAAQQALVSAATASSTKSQPNSSNTNRLANGISTNASATSSTAMTITAPSTPADVCMTDADADFDPRASIHEEEAAQALTGLRLSSAGSAASAAAAAAAVAAVGLTLPPAASPAASPRPPMLPVSTPTGRDLSAIPSTVPYNLTLPSVSPSHAMPLYPHHGHPLGHSVHLGHHHMPPTSAAMFAPVAVPSGSPMAMGTPRSLPSIFARGLLAPIASPYDPNQAQGLGQVAAAFAASPLVAARGTPLATPMGTPMGTPMAAAMPPFVDWKSLSVQQINASNDAAAAAAVAALGAPPAADNVPMLTPVTSVYRPTPPASGQASPVKRKSIAAKQQQLVSQGGAATTANATLSLPIAKSLAALERTHPTRKANPRRWTKEEDDALRTAVENHKEKNWKAIAAQVPGRNHTQCLQRWTKVLAPGLVKGHWSPHEDELLKRLVAGGNKNWGEVAAKIPGRTSKQCRERWHNHLDPNIVRGAYSPEEDRIILEAQARLGNRWSVIAAMLPGRTEDAVKIRWKSHCRLWKARKYLRKTGAADGSGAAAASGVGDEEAGGDDFVDADDDSSDELQDEADDETMQDEDDGDREVEAEAEATTAPAAAAAAVAASSA